MIPITIVRFLEILGYVVLSQTSHGIVLSCGVGVRDTLKYSRKRNLYQLCA